MLLDASGPDKKISPRLDDRSLQAHGVWQDGIWRVLMKRPRNGGESGDLNFIEGQFLPVSFANWDGSNGEKGAKHTLTTWSWLVLPPQVDYSRLYGISGGISLALFFAGLMLVRSQRRNRV